LTGKKKEISNLSPIFESLSFFCGWWFGFDFLF
jgi:hypothetical protein